MLISFDLRKRVIESVEQGMSITDAADTFKVSRTSVHNWKKLKEKTNSLKPKSGYQKGHSHKITDWNIFRDFVEHHKMLTVNEMIVEWKKSFNQTISASTIERALKKCNYTFKKKLLDIQNQMKKSVKYFWKKLKT